MQTGAEHTSSVLYPGSGCYWKRKVRLHPLAAWLSACTQCTGCKLRNVSLKLRNVNFCVCARTSQRLDLRNVKLKLRNVSLELRNVSLECILRARLTPFDIGC